MLCILPRKESQHRGPECFSALQCFDFSFALMNAPKPIRLISSQLDHPEYLRRLEACCLPTIIGDVRRKLKSMPSQTPCFDDTRVLGMVKENAEQIRIAYSVRSSLAQRITGEVIIEPAIVDLVLPSITNDHDRLE